MEDRARNQLAELAESKKKAEEYLQQLNVERERTIAQINAILGAEAALKQLLGEDPEAKEDNDD